MPRFADQNFAFIPSRIESEEGPDRNDYVPGPDRKDINQVQDYDKIDELESIIQVRHSALNLYCIILFSSGNWPWSRQSI